MKAASVILLIIGLAIMPGYYFYCTNFSGTEISIPQPLVFSSGKCPRDKSSYVEGSYQAVELSLTPEMSPVAIDGNFRCRSPKSMSNQNAVYSLSMAKSGRTISTGNVSLRVEYDSDRRNKRNEVTKLIKLVEVDTPGTYKFSMKRTGNSKLKVENITLSARKNVTKPNMAIVWFGVGCLISAVVGWCLASTIGSE